MIQEVCVRITFAMAVRPARVVSKKEIHPALDAWFSFYHIVNRPEALVASENRKTVSGIECSRLYIQLLVL